MARSVRTRWVESACSSETDGATTVGKVVSCNAKLQLSPEGTAMIARKRLVVVLASALLLSACATTVALVPGASKVRATSKTQDVTGCTAVGNVRLPPSPPGSAPVYANPIDDLRNQTVGLGGNTLFVTSYAWGEGVAYRCP